MTRFGSPRGGALGKVTIDQLVARLLELAGQAREGGKTPVAVCWLDGSKTEVEDLPTTGWVNLTLNPDGEQHLVIDVT